MGKAGLLSPVNTIIKDTLQRRLARASEGEHLEHHLCEFDDFRYFLEASSDDPGRLCLSVGLPHSQNHALPQYILALIDSRLGAVSQRTETPKPGYDLTIIVSLRALGHLSEEVRKDYVTRLASIRILVTEPRLRWLLDALVAGDVTASPVEVFHSSKGEPFFVKPQDGPVVVLYGIPSASSKESSLIASFMLEFAENGAKTSSQPTCAYYPFNYPPREVHGVPDETLMKCPGGFLSFTLHKRHVEGGNGVDGVLWHLATFRAFLGNHVRFSKACFRVQMRNRASSMVASLKRAKFQNRAGERLRRTATGRTFVPPNA